MFCEAVFFTIEKKVLKTSQINIGLFIAAVVSTSWASIIFKTRQGEEVTVELGIWGEWRYTKNQTDTIGKKNNVFSILVLVVK